MDGKRLTDRLHCWSGKYDYMAPADPEYRKLLVDGDATCMLPLGHDGPHVYTLDADIKVHFPPGEQYGR